jgi:hypothetical protein
VYHFGPQYHINMYVFILLDNTVNVRWKLGGGGAKAKKDFSHLFNGYMEPHNSTRIWLIQK